MTCMQANLAPTQPTARSLRAAGQLAVPVSPVDSAQSHLDRGGVVGCMTPHSCCKRPNHRAPASSVLLQRLPHAQQLQQAQKTWP